MKQAMLMVAIAEDDKGECFANIHTTGPEGSNSYNIVLEMQKMLSNAMNADQKPSPMKPMEG